jgi:hypothetical protein
MNASSPQRLAWTVLYAALFTCVALAVGVPAGIYAYLNNATNAAVMHLSLQAGILATYSPVESIKDARVVDLAGREFKEEHTFVAGDRSLGLLTYAHSAAEAPYVQVQLYSNAQGTVERARIPRFDSARASDEFTLRLTAGRVDVLAEPSPGRRFRAVIVTDAGELQITQAGQYSIEVVDGRTRATAHTGAAMLKVGRNVRTLEGTSVEIADGRIVEAPPAVELLQNGFFRTPLEPTWTLTTQVNAPDAIRGTIIRIDRRDAPGTLQLERTGENIGWGRTSAGQPLDATVTDATDLRLRVVFTILEQQLSVCGSEGTECPLMVRIDYTTKDGRDDFWLQGFYAKGDPSVVKLPDYVRSNFRGNHIAKPLGVRQVYESENLLTQLGSPRTIRSVTLYAEGHALRTSIDSVELRRK